MKEKKKSHYHCIVSATRQVPIALVRVALVRVALVKEKRSFFEMLTKPAPF